MLLLLLPAILIFADAEHITIVPTVSFDYPHEVLADYSNLNVSKKTINFPWPVLMHGTYYFSADFYSSSRVYFDDLVIRIGYTSYTNTMDALSLVRTNDNFTVRYVGHNKNNASLVWSITFFRDGYQKFLVVNEASPNNLVKLYERAGLYQTIDGSVPVMLSQCSTSGCTSHEKDCNSEDDCRQRYPECFGEGTVTCINEVAMLLSLAVSIPLTFFTAVGCCICCKTRCCRDRFC